MNLITKNVFISSTVYDLRYERAMVRRLLENYAEPTGIRFRCFVSDHPDFPISPLDRATKHSFDMCIEAVAKADYFVLLLRKRYGTPVIHNNGNEISIAHLEYREAQRLNIPRFILVDSRTWNAKHKYDRGFPQKFVPVTQTRIFGLIDEIRKRTRGNWIDIFSSRNDLSRIITSFLFQYDDSLFIGDVTIPHGTIVRTETSFVKVWEIQNNGLTTWKDRYLREENPTPGGLEPRESLIRIPNTNPGERAQISVEFTTPIHPVSCESYWKMVFKNGPYCFPDKTGLTCCVKVT